MIDIKARHFLIGAIAYRENEAVLLIQFEYFLEMLGPVGLIVKDLYLSIAKLIVIVGSEADGREHDAVQFRPDGFSPSSAALLATFFERSFRARLQRLYGLRRADKRPMSSALARIVQPLL